MFRRIVFLLLVPTLLLQGLAVAHSHDGSGVHEPPDHDRTPHFHFGGLFGSPAHPCDNDDTDHDDGDEDDHDDDAVYAPMSVMLDRCQQTQVGEPAYWVLASFGLAFDNSIISSARSFSLTHPPPMLCFQGCPIYLQTLALRI